MANGSCPSTWLGKGGPSQAPRDARSVVKTQPAAKPSTTSPTGDATSPRLQQGQSREAATPPRSPDWLRQLKRQLQDAHMVIRVTTVINQVGDHPRREAVPHVRILSHVKQHAMLNQCVNLSSIVNHRKSVTGIQEQSQLAVHTRIITIVGGTYKDYYFTRWGSLGDARTLCGAPVRRVTIDRLLPSTPLHQGPQASAYCKG